MKINKSDIKKVVKEVLSEATGLPYTIKVGKTITTAEGHTLKVTNVTIVVSAVRREPDVYVDYEYKTSSGKKGKESVSVTNFSDNVKGK